MVIVDIVYFGLALIIAINDTFFKQAPHYTIADIILRISILLPLIFFVVQGKSKYAKVLYITLWIVLLADTLLPVSLPLGMGVFLVAHLFNSYNFSQYIDFCKEKLLSILLPALFAYGVALGLYFYFLFSHENLLFKIFTAIYLVVITLAWSFSMTNYVQSKAKWALMASIGMFLFFCTDFQVAYTSIAEQKIPFEGFVNAFTYYTGLFLMSKATQFVET
ncbi:MAG: hypothetical protein CL920_33170 [Deltaproteobacteria bacterium]|nr:hypothetical protein [Deltaproteobacteria bacterium]MBU53575.1 hypothetical protein [Deltaproteobacteria bacterium]|tara:strand:+ start:7144 stop:7803 length:660 start_codon:yes stop_codon:yes gene_type:complete